jgi:hypothetical protein
MICKIITFTSICLALMACATRPVNPNAIQVDGGLIVDGTGKDHSKIRQDAADCSGIAEATNPTGNAAAGAAAGAVIGAIAGAILFRAAGLSGNDGAAYGAGMGALSGGTNAAAGAAQDFRTVARNCMLARGHAVLN